MSGQWSDCEKRKFSNCILHGLEKSWEEGWKKVSDEFNNHIPSEDHRTTEQCRSHWQKKGEEYFSKYPKIKEQWEIVRPNNVKRKRDKNDINYVAISRQKKNKHIQPSINGKLGKVLHISQLITSPNGTDVIILGSRENISIRVNPVQPYGTFFAWFQIPSNYDPPQEFRSYITYDYRYVSLPVVSPLISQAARILWYMKKLKKKTVPLIILRNKI